MLKQSLEIAFKEGFILVKGCYGPVDSEIFSFDKLIEWTKKIIK